MPIKYQTRNPSAATLELARRCPDLNAGEIVDSLTAGMTHLRDLLLLRVHEDVEQFFGVDSMVAPVSKVDEEAQTLAARVEIEVYSMIVVDDEVRRCRFLERPDGWFLDWLFHLRLRNDHRPLFDKRVEFYRSPSAEDRRLKFLSILQAAVPESTRTPLVLFRLFPRAVRIAAAVAFGDPLRAQELRAEQCSFLPAVGDCEECHGRVLENDEICRACGNPVWDFAWLQSD